MRYFTNLTLLILCSFFSTAQIDIPADLQKKFAIYNSLTSEYFIFKKNLKSEQLGIVNRTGTIILPAIYDEIHFYQEGLFVVRKGPGFGVVNTSNKVILPFEFRMVNILSADRLHVQKDGMSFIVSSSNRFITDTTDPPHIFVQVGERIFSPPMILRDIEADGFAGENSNYITVFDTVYLVTQNDTIRTDYQAVYSLNSPEGYSKFKKNNLWGIMNEKGKELIPAKYDDIEQDYTTSLIAVKTGKKQTLLTPKLKPVTSVAPFDWIDISNEDSLAIIHADGKAGIINAAGKFILPLAKNDISKYGDYHFYIRSDTGWRADIVDKNMKSINPKGTTVGGYSGNIILLRNKENKAGIMHAAGYLLIPVVYDEVFFGNTDGEDDQFFQARKGNKWAVLDMNNNQVSPFIYDKIYLFKQGYAVAVLNGKQGVISAKNETIIPFIYDEISTDDDNFEIVRVIKDKLYGFLDRKGQPITPIIYEYADEEFAGGLSLAKKNGKWGYLDKSGKEVIPFEYDEAKHFYYSETTKVRKGTTWYQIDKTGKVLGETTKP